MKPYPFEKIQQNCALFKQHDSIDGLSVNVMMPLGNQFQMGGEWKFSNSKGSSFELMTSINNSNGNPRQDPSEVQSGVFRFASDQTGMVLGNFNLPYNVILQTQTMFNDPHVKEVMNLLSFQRDWNDCSLVARYQGMGG